MRLGGSHGPAEDERGSSERLAVAALSFALGPWMRATRAGWSLSVRLQSQTIVLPPVELLLVFSDGLAAQSLLLSWALPSLLFVVHALLRTRHHSILPTSSDRKSYCTAVPVPTYRTDYSSRKQTPKATIEPASTLCWFRGHLSSLAIKQNNLCKPSSPVDDIAAHRGA